MLRSIHRRLAIRNALWTGLRWFWWLCLVLAGLIAVGLFGCLAVWVHWVYWFHAAYLGWLMGREAWNAWPLYRGPL